MGLQVLLNGALTGAHYALLGLSFALVYRVGKFFLFSHAAVFASGAYFTLVLYQPLGMPFGVACGVAIGLSGLLGVLTEVCVYSPLRVRGASPVALLVASLGVYVVLQNIISISCGDAAAALRAPVRDLTVSFGDLRVSRARLWMGATCAAAIILTLLALATTRLGVLMRAVANDCELAVIAGIEAGQIRAATFFVGSALAGLAGILAALDTNLTPTMGMSPFLMAVVAVIIGGARSNGGVVLGGVLVGEIQNYTSWLLSSLWQNALVFGVLILFLLLRPQGIFGAHAPNSVVRDMR